MSIYEAVIVFIIICAVSAYLLKHVIMLIIHKDYNPYEYEFVDSEVKEKNWKIRRSTALGRTPSP